jgi:hypothetical protein
MTLSADAIAALNKLPLHVPALAPGGNKILVGDEIAESQVSGSTVALVASLKAVATATVVADVTATAVTEATADATDLASAEALANSLKANYNTAVTELSQLKALVNDLKTQLNALTNGIDAL